MKSYQVEKNYIELPSHAPRPYRGVKPDWVGMLNRGEAILTEARDIPHFDTFDQFKKWMFSYRVRLTVASTRRELDHCLSFLTPEEKKKITSMWRKSPDEKGGELTFGDTVLRIRPLGRGGGLGLKKISVHRYTGQRGGSHAYLLDFSYLGKTLEEVRQILKFCEEVGIYPSYAGTAAGTTRNLLKIYAPKAFRGINEEEPKGLGPKVLKIHQAALNVWRLGRFEAFSLGTIKRGRVYDRTADFLSKVGGLHHAGRPYCQWEEWKGNYDDLTRDDIIYAFLHIREYIPKGPVSIASHRVFTLGGSKQFYPYGLGDRWIGLEQYRLRLARGMRPTVLGGWMGYSEIEFYPFKVMQDKMWEGRQTHPKLLKQFDAKLAGNFMATYWTQEFPEEGPQEGEAVKEPLETWAPEYGAAITDASIAETSAICLLVPADKLYGANIDGVQIGVDLPTSLSKELGGWNLQYEGLIRRFSDHLGDKDGSTKWADRYRGNYLELPKIGLPTLVGTFGRSGGDVKEQEKRFNREDPLPPQKIPVRSSKRFSMSGIDYLTDSAPTVCPDIMEIPDLCVEGWIDDDYTDIDEEA